MRFLSQLAAFFLLCHIASCERWSRQLSVNAPIVNDWVPISHDKKSGKSITFGDDLMPAAQTQQFQFFTEPLNNRFNLQQQHPAHHAHPASAPSEINSFIQNSPPQFQFLNAPQKQRTVQTFGGAINNKPHAEPLIQNPPPFQFMQEVQRAPHVHHYQSQPIPKNIQTFTQHQPIPQFQNIQPQGQSRVPHFQKLPTPPPSFQQIAQNQQQQSQAESEQPVQLLYVPFDSLYQQNQQQQPPQTTLFGNDKQTRFNILNQPVSASLINDLYSQNEVQEIPKKIATTKRPPTIAPPTTSYRLTTPFESVSKLKPHQPPLSMFVAIDNKKGRASESDVLNTLKNSNTIDVMDSIGNSQPKVFIGPSGMEAPNGYQKFELPYLSNIDGTRSERKVEQLPFFVAPLSYKTPPGFSKIPLPAPHVGSVVVNQPPNTIESNESSGFTQDAYYTKQPQIISSSLNNIRNSNLNSNNNNNNNNNDDDINDPSKKNTQTVKLTSGFHFSSNGNVQLFSNEFDFPTISPPTTHPPRTVVYTTARPTFIQSSITPSTPLTKVKASIVRDHYTTTQIPTTVNPGPTKNNVLYEINSNPRSEFFSSPRSTATRTYATTQTPFYELDEHKTVNEEYFNVNKPSFEYDFESKQQKPKKDFNFKPIPEFNFESLTTTLPPQTTTKRPRTKPTTTTTTTIKTTTTTSAPSTRSSTPREIFESVPEYSFPSTPNAPYTPTFEYTPTVSIIENTDTFRQTHGGNDFFTDFHHHSTPRPTSQNYLVDIDEINNRNRQRFNGDGHSTIDTTQSQQQKQKDHDFFHQQEHLTETESPNYNLPSELPPISAHLPGLINSLMDDKWMQINNITDNNEEYQTKTTTTTTTTTRRPNTRGRTRVSSSSSSPSSPSSTYRTTAEPNYERKQQVTRGGRRPSSSSYSSRNIISSTESTFPSRSTATRSSKIKYNITSEDQSRFRTRNRRPVQKKEEENIEYQRDVLNQNYPSSVRPPAASAPTERVIESVHIHSDNNALVDIPNAENINDYNAPVESIEVIPLGGNNYNSNIEPQFTPDNPLYYENTIDTSSTTTTTTTTTTTPLPPSTQKLHKNHKYANPNDQESFLIPQHKTVSHRLKGNFNFNRNIDSFYNNVKSQDTTDATPSSKDDDQIIITVPSTTTTTTVSTTTTTEAQPETEAPATRRTNFPRRRLYTTTTESSSIGETESTESYGSRSTSRGRKENVVVVKKVRSRGGRPTTTTTTTEAPETTRRTAVRNRASYNTNNRNVYRERTQPNNENNNSDDNRPRFRIRENTPRFRLDTQESQWSTRLNQNSFQPVDEEKSKAFHSQEVNDNQEIVTAGPIDENESYLVNVSASVVPTKKPIEIDDDSLNMISTTEREDDLAKRVKDDDADMSLDKLVKEVIDDIEKDSRSEKKATKLDKKNGNARRGVWRKVKVRPADAFETAETQNIGKHLYNSVTDNDKKESEKPSKVNEDEITQLPSVTTTINPKINDNDITTTLKPTTAEDLITTSQPDIVDDSKTRMFDDARKAFVEFLSTEDDTDDAVNMEEADDKLERDSTTTTQIPTTDESITTTTLPPITSTLSTVEAETVKPSRVTKEKKQIKTSTSQKVTGEICFRGRCIKTSEK